MDVKRTQRDETQPSQQPTSGPTGTAPSGGRLEAVQGADMPGEAGLPLQGRGRTPQSGREEGPAPEALTYIENHGERMHCADACESGLPFGGGNDETACKSLVSLRMKRPGSRWKETTGQNVLDLAPSPNPNNGTPR